MAYERFNADNAAMLLIDHQVGTIEWMHSAPKSDVIRNTLALAKTAKELGMPVLLTSSQEDQTQGLLLPELKALLPEAHQNRVKRGGIVDAFDDPNFTAAVKATGRNKLIMAGLLTEVCLIYPALNAQDEGYEVQAVADASGSGTKLGDEIALSRMQQAGIGVTSTIQIMSELVFDWSKGAGPKILPVLGEIYAELGE
ncbi:isochorismatase family protein [Rhodobiaceae bacterium]|nr:isochorismatase family protein [Rhodobiaceae bacterium]